MYFYHIEFKEAEKIDLSLIQNLFPVCHLFFTDGKQTQSNINKL